ncbi:MAG: hypothetical protein ACF8TS_06450 [Maioricimonas sp. JB049]
MSEIRARGSLTEVEHREHCEHWLDLFLKVIPAHPESPHRKTAIGKAVGLANSLGKPDISQRLIELRLKEPDTESEKLFWSGQLLQAARMEGAAASIDSSVDVLRETVADIRERVLTSDSSDLRHEYANACMRLGNTLLERGTNLEEAAQFLDEATRQAREGYGGPVGPRDRQGNSILGGLLKSRLKIATARTEDEVALRLLRELAQTQPASAGTSMEALKYARQRFGEDPKQVNSFVDYRLATQPGDAITPVVRVRLGELLYESGRLREAKDVMLQIQKNGEIAALLKLSAGQIRQGYGGVAGDYWFTRGMIHAKLREIDDARMCLATLRELAPKEQIANTLESRIVLTRRAAGKRGNG